MRSGNFANTCKYQASFALQKLFKQALVGNFTNTCQYQVSFDCKNLIGRVGEIENHSWRCGTTKITAMRCSLVFFVVFFASNCRQAVFAGSCREAKLCCTGRDSSCVVQKAPLNAIIEDLNDKPCYCDHACLKLGDCCTDFKEACGGKCKN